MELRRFLILVTVALVILLIIAAWFLPLDDDFRVENPLWNGTKDMHTSHPAQPLESLSDLPSSPQGATLIFIPYLSCTPGELEQLSSFITKGGRLILADDYGYGNQVLEYLELEMRFSSEPLLDPLTNYRNREFPRIVHLKPDALTINTESLIFNHATCLINTENTSTIAMSSSFSFLDENENGTRDDDELTGPLPVIYRHHLGDGEMVLVSDPSLFINSMKQMDENDSFIQNVVATTKGNLYIDQSHLPPSDLHRTKSLLAQGRNLLKKPLVTAGLVTLILIIALKPVWYRKKENREET